MRFSTLLFLLVFGAGFYLIYNAYSKLSEETFEVKLVDVKPTQIQFIQLGQQKEVFTLTKEPVGWIASNEQSSVKALPNPIHLLIQNIAQIEVDSIITLSEKDWSLYGVDQSNGLNVQLQTFDRERESFILGKSGSSENYRFIRLHHQKEVYQIKGPGIPTIPAAFNKYRSSHLNDANLVGVVDKIKLRQRDSLIAELYFKEDKWYHSNQALEPADSIDDYLTSLNTLSSSAFADQFDDLRIKKLPWYSISYSFTGKQDSLLIQCYQDTFTNDLFILKSNRNEAFFLSDSSGLYRTIFNPNIFHSLTK